MTVVTGGRAVLETLKLEGARYIFGIVGYGCLDILDAMHGDGAVTFIGVRHEQAAALMADGFARSTNSPGVCLVTSGPGATNLITGISQAYIAHSPIIALAGGLSREYQHRDAFQELDLVSLFRPITKLSAILSKAERIPDLIRHAYRVATTGTKGPVFLEIPGDLLHETAVRIELDKPTHSRSISSQVDGDSFSIARAADLLSTARRPMILAGAGVVLSGAGSETVALADVLGAALVTSYGRNDAVPNEHPRYLGPIGRAGSAEAARAMQRCDVLLALGTRLSHFSTFFDDRYLQRATRIIQVELDPKEIGRHYPVEVGIWGDAKAVAAGIFAVLSNMGSGALRSNSWRGEVEELVKHRRDRLKAERLLSSVPIKPQRVYAELRQVIPRDAIVTLDAGAAAAAAYDRLYFSEPRTFFTPLDLGALGVAYPIALGAKLGRPDKTVISINGDGGFLFNAQEFQTAIDYGLNVVAVVMNNGEWGSEKAFQKHYYEGRYVGVDIGNPRYDKYAQLFGGRGFYCEYPDQISDAFIEALACGKPAILEIPIDPEELSRPD